MTRRTTTTRWVDTPQGRVGVKDILDGSGVHVLTLLVNAGKLATVSRAPQGSSHRWDVRINDEVQTMPAQTLDDAAKVLLSANN